MKILLDPLIYWFPNDSEKEANLLYLNKVTSIIEKYFEIKYISSEYLIQIFYKLNKEPFSTTSREQSIMRQNVLRRVLGNLDYPNNIHNFNCEAWVFPDTFKVTRNDELNNYFAKIVDYLFTENIPCLLFLAKQNSKSDIKSKNQLFIIKNISGELDSKITELIMSNQFLKHGLAEPVLANPLPFSDLCDAFKELQYEMMKEDDEISVFWRITREVAFRNRYTFDAIVTNKNTSNEHKRKIYTYDKKHYISADFESGCFELCDHRGKHKREISYIGKELNPRDETCKHDIRV